MALKNFIKNDSYTRITHISIHKESKRVNFEIQVYDSNGGAKLFGPLRFEESQGEAIEEYKNTNLILPEAPIYPRFCEDKEKMVPMWTEISTDEERAEYNSIKNNYENEIKEHKNECADLCLEVETAAETENEYSKYFSDEKLYQDSNATACAYEFLKAQPGFEGVIDV